MIFVGDISLPFKNAITVHELPLHLKKDQTWFANLEGAIINEVESKAESENWTVFNTKDAVRELFKTFDFAGFALANNHIFDTGSYENTINFLRDINIPFVGIGEKSNSSSSAVSISKNGEDLIVLNFGWEVIQCEIAAGNKIGVIPLIKDYVIKTFKQVKLDNPYSRIIVFFHWNYELEAYPQPAERELARYLIDHGAAGIIGCHPHRIGGFELYKNSPIVYSLGNWMFLQNFYHKGKIRFPDFCNLELAFEWDFRTSELSFHFFEYDKEKSELTFSRTEGIESETMTALTPFRDMSNDDYKKWYKLNRYHRNKGLPVYYWEDGKFVVNAKNYTNKLRDKLIYLAVKSGVK